MLVVGMLSFCRFSPIESLAKPTAPMSTGAQYMTPSSVSPTESSFCATDPVPSNPHAISSHMSQKPLQ